MKRWICHLSRNVKFVLMARSKRCYNMILTGSLFNVNRVLKRVNNTLNTRFFAKRLIYAGFCVNKCSYFGLLTLRLH